MNSLLHIASFEGNIGDNASHLGFYEILNQIGFRVSVDQKEIRKAYKNYKLSDKIEFDKSFANLANRYDYIVFGGGGFLDYWVKGSSNGTTIDINETVLDLIKKPILMSSVGSNPHREVPAENYNKFQKFLQYIKSKDNITIALRNDGSMDSIRKDFGVEYLDLFNEVLDHGFFYSPRNVGSKLNYPNKYAAINITNDQLEMFNEGRALINKEKYFEELKIVVCHLIEEKNLDVVFVPHIYGDVAAISEFLKYLPDHYLRKNIGIAPYYQGNSAADFNFDVYKNSDLVIASRYHANVCSMNFGKLVIGLSPLKRIEYIHNQFCSSDTHTYITENFSARVLSAIEKDKTPDVYKLKCLKDKTLSFYREYFGII